MQRGFEDGGPGWAARILSRRLADTCGTELSGNRVNESWKEGNGRVTRLSISPRHYQLDRRSSAHHWERERQGGQ